MDVSFVENYYLQGAVLKKLMQNQPEAKIKLEIEGSND